MDTIVLGSIIRFHRKKAKLTQKELGYLANIGKTIVFDIEKGKESVQLKSLLRVLHVLNIKLDLQGPLMLQYKVEHLVEETSQ